MSDLEIDYGMLRETGHALRYVATELEGAKDIAEGYRDAVGYGPLSDRIHEFGSNWDIHRKEIIEAVSSLADVSTGAGDAADKIERELVDTLTGKK